MQGTIIKAIAGFYYVKTDEGIYECRARGIFKNEGITPYVGDEVSIEVTHEGDMEGFVTEIAQRSNSFIRPPIANVEQFAIVVAATKPKPSTLIIDKFLVMAEHSGTDIVLIITKADIDKAGHAKRLESIYKSIYPVYIVNPKTGHGMESLEEVLKGKRTAFAGASGVGKSTLLNRLHPEANAQVGGVSEKTKRGRHTTRHVELYDMDFGGQIYDTPGFTSFEIMEADEDELHHMFPEMRPYIGKCRFDDCRHLEEPECAVLRALEEGKINESRYASYRAQIESIREEKKWQY